MPSDCGKWVVVGLGQCPEPGGSATPWQGPAGGWTNGQRSVGGAPGAPGHAPRLAMDRNRAQDPCHDGCEGWGGGGPAPPTAILKPPAARCSAACSRHPTPPSIAVKLFRSGAQRRWRTRSFSWLARTLSALCRSISVIPTILASHAGADASGSENAGARGSWPQVSCRPPLCMAAAWGSPHQVTRCTADRNLQRLCGNLSL